MSLSWKNTWISTASSVGTPCIHLPWPYWSSLGWFRRYSSFVIPPLVALRSLRLAAYHDIGHRETTKAPQGQVSFYCVPQPLRVLAGRLCYSQGYLSAVAHRGSGGAAQICGRPHALDGGPCRRFARVEASLAALG